MSLPKFGSFAAAKVVAAILICLGACLQAHERPTPAQLAEARRRGDLKERLDFMRALGTDRMSPELEQRAKAKIEAARLRASGWSDRRINLFAPPPSARGLPTTGSPKALTIMVDFADNRAPATPSIADIAANLYGQGTPAAQAFAPFESLNRYYFRASEGMLDIRGNVLGWYRFPNNRSFYQPGSSDDTAQNQAIFNMFKAAMNSFDATHDFSQYDNDGDGYLDAVTMMYQGQPGSWASFWWAYQWSFFVNEASTLSWDGKKLNKFVFQFVEKRGTGSTDYEPQTMIHEMGHLLGLPDYYDYTPDQLPKGGVGGLDVMDANKGNHNAFSRWVLDWITPQIVGTGSPQLRTLHASGDTSLPGNKAVVVYPNAANSPFGQFFMVENRQRIGNDAGRSGLPSDGLLIWHVDAGLSGGDFKNNNSDSTPKLLRLVQADGNNSIEAGGNADAGDYYTSAKSFTATSNPPSKANQGTVTNVSVTNISANNRIMTAMIGFGNATTSVVATPIITPQGGVFVNPVNVTIACDTAGATIRYTVDGSSPTASSAVYTSAFALSATATVRAKAFKSGLSDSAIASASFTFNTITALTDGVGRTGLQGALGSAAYFVINVPAGETKLEIKSSGGTGDLDLYVRQGSLPTLTDYDYRPNATGNTETAVISNPAAGPWYVLVHGYQAYSGAALLADYSRMAAKVATPIFSPAPGTYSGAVNVVMSCATAGATIRYTTDRSEPNELSPVYSGPVSVTASGQLRARAFFASFTNSDIATGDYVINSVGTTVTTLTDNVPRGGLGGAVGSFQHFKIDVPAGESTLSIRTSGGTGDCDLYVKLGSMPTLSSYDYRPYAGGNTETVDVSNPSGGTWYIMINGFTAYSGVTLVADHSRVLDPVAIPVFTPAPGTYPGSVSVTLSSATAGATIRYTLDGSTPSATSPVYSVPIGLTTTTTVRARGFKAGQPDSPVASGAYTVTAVNGVTPLADGVARVVSGAINTEQSFLIRVPAGQTLLVIKTSGGTGDCDLYVKRGAPATTSSYDHRPYSVGNNETVEIPNPTAGDYYILLRGFAAFSRVSLLADFRSTLTPVAAPVMTPNGGTFTAAPVLVSLSSATAGATIRYTTDGSQPNTGSTIYTEPLRLTANTTVNARAEKEGHAPSPVVSKNFVLRLPAEATVLADGVNTAVPASLIGSERLYRITVPAGMARLDLQISGGTGECDLYVKQGTPATLTSYDYRPFLPGNLESVSINNPAAGDWFLLLHGYAAYGGVRVRADYIPALATVGTPVLAPGPGSYVGQVRVAMTCPTAGAIIRYTLDGNEPVETSSPYTAPVLLTTTTEVKARAFKAGMNASAVRGGVYTITGPPVTDLVSGGALSRLSGARGSQAFFRFFVPPGQARLTVSLSGGTGDCDLYLRQGALPTLEQFDHRPFLVGNLETVTVDNPAAGDWYVMLSGYLAYSRVTLRADVLPVLPVASAPVITPGAGSHTLPLAVRIQTETPGAQIRYTVDGNAPTESSSLYTVPFALNSSATVRAIAVRDGYTNSTETSAAFTLTAPQAIELTDGGPVNGLSGAVGNQALYKITVPAGQARLTIRISRGTGDCDLYVRQGNSPTLAAYDFRPFLGGNNETVQIDAPAAGEWFILLSAFEGYSGLTLLADYVTGTVAAPSFTPAPGNYLSATSLNVTMASSTSGAVIYYTVDGSTPTASSALYTGPVSVSGTTTVRAIATRSNYLDSTVTTGVYSVTTPPVNDLDNDVALGAFSGSAGSSLYFAISVPGGQGVLRFQMSGTTGDADLHVRRDQLPTSTLYDFRPYLSGSNESVTITNPAAGTWYVLIRGYSSFRGVTLKASYGATLGQVATPVILPGSGSFTGPVTVNLACATAGATIHYTTDGQPPSTASPVYTGPFTISATSTVRAIAGLSLYADSAAASATFTISGPSVNPLVMGTPSGPLNASVGSFRYFQITVPSGVTDLAIGIEGGIGDCDLYVREGQRPTLADWDFRPFVVGNREEVVLSGVTSGATYYVMLHAYAAYTGLTLDATELDLSLSDLNPTATFTNLSGAAGQRTYYRIVVPPGSVGFVLTTSGGSGDCDLYLGAEFLPSPRTFDAASVGESTVESIAVNSGPGEYFILVDGFAAFSGVTLSSTVTN